MALSDNSWGFVSILHLQSQVTKLSIYCIYIIKKYLQWNHREFSETIDIPLAFLKSFQSFFSSSLYQLKIRYEYFFKILLGQHMFLIQLNFGLIFINCIHIDDFILGIIFSCYARNKFLTSSQILKYKYPRMAFKIKTKFLVISRLYLKKCSI